MSEFNSGAKMGDNQGYGVLGAGAGQQETVNHPQHYGGDTPYEVIKVLEAWLTPEEFAGFLKGNVIKYAARASKKGRSQEDIAKHAWYAKYHDDWLKRTTNRLSSR